MLIEQWRSLMEDHRAAQARFITLSASFPVVLVGAITVATADFEGILAVEALQWLPFAPVVAILWWAGILSFVGVTSIKRYRILRILEHELRREAPQSVWPISEIMGIDPSSTLGAVKWITRLSGAIVGLVGAAVYIASVVFALSQLDSRGNVDSKTIAWVAVAVASVTLAVAGITAARVRFYLSKSFDEAVRETMRRLWT